MANSSSCSSSLRAFERLVTSYTDVLRARADHAFYNIHKELHNPFGGRTLDIAHRTRSSWEACNAARFTRGPHSRHTHCMSL